MAEKKCDLITEMNKLKCENRSGLPNIIVVYDFASINGGAAKIAVESAIALSEAGYHVDYFAAVGPVERRLADSRVRVTCLDETDINTGNPIRAAIKGIWNKNADKKMRELLSEYSAKNTVIHFHGWTHALSVSVVHRAKKMGFCCLVTLHDYFMICPNGGIFNYQKQEICQFRPLSLRCICCNCDKRNYFHKLWRVARQAVQNRVFAGNENISYIFVSAFSREVFRKYVKFDRGYLVNNPIEMKDSIKVDAHKNDNYLYIGRLSEEKGIRLFCRAVSDLNLKGVVVGEGGLLQEMKEKYPNIEFAGWQDYEGVKQYLLKARCLVFPSLLYETLGLTILEAAAFGIPSIVSDCCAGKAMTEACLVFQSNSLEDIKQKMTDTLDDSLVMRAGDKAYDLFEKYNTPMDSHVNRLSEIYGRLV